MFKLEIDATDNDAFADGNRATEIVRILRRVAKLIEAGRTEGKIQDVNGNTVGSFYLEEED